MTDRTLDSLSAALVAQATSGDEKSLDQILRTLATPFYNLALGMLLNHQDAEDATQECLIWVTTRLSTFKGKSRFSTWAWTVATRTILDFKNGLARQPRLDGSAFSLDLADGFDASARMASQEDQLFASQVKLGCGRAMLQILDGDHRMAYVMVDILELDQGEAAEAVGVTPATFRKRLSRARSRMRAVLSKNCGIVDSANRCRCIGRVERAQQLGRIEPEDSSSIDPDRLADRIQSQDEIAREAAFFRADPQVTPSERVLPKLRRLFGDL